MNIFLNPLTENPTRQRLYSDLSPGDVFVLKDLLVNNATESYYDWNYGNPYLKINGSGAYNLLNGRSISTTPSASTPIAALEKSFILNPSDYTTIIQD